MHKGAVPSKPLQIRVVSGESYEVPRPVIISISPKGSLVVLIDAEDRPHHLSTLLIENFSPSNGWPACKGGKRR